MISRMSDILDSWSGPGSLSSKSLKSSVGLMGSIAKTEWCEALDSASREFEHSVQAKPTNKPGCIQKSSAYWYKQNIFSHPRFMQRQLSTNSGRLTGRSLSPGRAYSQGSELFPGRCQLPKIILSGINFQLPIRNDKNWNNEETNCANSSELSCSSRQSSVIDNQSDTTVDSCTEYVNRQYSSSSALSSSCCPRKPPVAHVIVLRGHYVSPRVRSACSCCVGVRRPRYRRKRWAQKRSRVTPHSCSHSRSRSRSRTRTDSSSTGGNAPRLVLAFLYKPGAASDDSESQSDSQCSPCGSDDEIETTDFNSEDVDLENYFCSFGLINIGNKSDQTDCGLRSKVAKQFVTTEPTRYDARSKRLRRDSELKWLQSDTKNTDNGVTYTYAVTNLPTSKLSASIRARLQNAVKPKGQQNTDRETLAPECIDAIQDRHSKKVRFASGSALQHVHPLCTWRYWSRRARQDEFLLRKARFDATVGLYSSKIDAVLSAEHRSRIFTNRFAPPTEAPTCDDAYAS